MGTRKKAEFSTKTQNPGGTCQLDLFAEPKREAPPQLWEKQRKNSPKSIPDRVPISTPKKRKKNRNRPRSKKKRGTNGPKYDRYRPGTVERGKNQNFHPKRKTPGVRAIIGPLCRTKTRGTAATMGKTEKKLAKIDTRSGTDFDPQKTQKKQKPPAIKEKKGDKWSEI